MKFTLTIALMLAMFAAGAQTTKAVTRDGDTFFAAKSDTPAKSDTLTAYKWRDGKRLATIELSLTNWKILQCRGVCNEVPKDYNAICGLVRKNVGLFKRAKLSLAS